MADSLASSRLGRDHDHTFSLEHVDAVAGSGRVGDTCPNLSTLVRALEADLSARLQRQQRALERIDALRSERDSMFDALRNIERACEVGHSALVPSLTVTKARVRSQGAPASAHASSPPATISEGLIAGRLRGILAQTPD